MQRLKRTYASHAYNDLRLLLAIDSQMTIARIWGRDNKLRDELSLSRLNDYVSRREFRSSVAADAFEIISAERLGKSELPPEFFVEMEFHSAIKRYIAHVRAMHKFREQYRAINGSFSLQKLKNRVTKRVAHHLRFTTQETKISPIEIEKLDKISWQEMRELVDETLQIVTDACYIFLNLSPGLSDTLENSKRASRDFWQLIGQSKAERETAGE